MKSIKKIAIVSVLLIIAISTKAQYNKSPYPDTLTLTTDSKIDIQFLFYRMSDKERHLTDDLWQSIISIMNSSATSSSYDGGIEVTYRKVKMDENEVAKVEVKEIENNSDVFLIGNEGMKEVRSERAEFKILLAKVAIVFSINSLSELEEISELSVESVWDQVNLKYKHSGSRKLYKGSGVFKYGKANISSINDSPDGTDSIELSSGVGIGFYRDRFVPDLGFKLGFNLPDRYGNPHIQLGALYTQHYFFTEQTEGEFNLDLNGFLSGFVTYHGIESYEIGLAIGGLIHREGSFFKGGTYKLSLYTSKDNSKVEFTPELIFTNDFKDAFPALRFGLSF